jgi:hypothetical protein
MTTKIRIKTLDDHLGLQKIEPLKIKEVKKKFKLKIIIF